MSYILDALRKADAQRERDASRGIHAQAVPAASAAATSEPGNRSGCMVAVAAAVVLGVGLAWYLMRGEPAPALVASSPAIVQQAPPAATAISPPPPPPAPVPAAVQAREAAFTARQAEPQAAAPVAQPGASSSAVPAPAAPAAPIAGGLPPDAPRIAISGGVYSPNPAQRMLIVNGQVFNEGSEVAPGVKVEAIQARTAVLGFRGARYTVAY